MNIDNVKRLPDAPQEDSRWGWFLVLAFLIGPPLIGVLFNLFGIGPQ